MFATPERPGIKDSYRPVAAANCAAFCKANANAFPTGSWISISPAQTGCCALPPHARVPEVVAPVKGGERRIDKCPMRAGRGRRGRSGCGGTGRKIRPQTDDAGFNRRDGGGVGFYDPNPCRAGVKQRARSDKRRPFLIRLPAPRYPRLALNPGYPWRVDRRVSATFKDARAAASWADIRLLPPSCWTFKLAAMASRRRPPQTEP